MMGTSVFYSSGDYGVQEMMVTAYLRIEGNLTLTRYYPSYIRIDSSNSGPTGKVFNPSFPVSFLLHTAFL